MPPLLMYGGATQEVTNIDDRYLEEEVVHLIKGGPVDLSILKNFKTHIA